MTDLPMNGKLLVLSQEHHPRLKYGIKSFVKYSDEELFAAVKEYELWQETSEFRLHYTICTEIAGSEEEFALFEAYDALCREIARRNYYGRSSLKI